MIVPQFGDICDSCANVDVEHAACIEKAKPPAFECATCGVPLLSAGQSGPLQEAIREQILRMPRITEHLPVSVSAAPTTVVNGVVTSRSTPTPIAPASSATPLASATSAEARVSQQALPMLSGQSPSAMGTIPNTTAIATKGRQPLFAPVHQAPETAVDVSAVPMMQQQSGHYGYGVNNTGPRRVDKSGAFQGTASALARKKMKAITRRLFEMRRQLAMNLKRTTMVTMFIICVVLIILLASGDDETESQPSARNEADTKVFLPHVRVNPAIAAQARMAQSASDDLDTQFTDDAHNDGTGRVHPGGEEYEDPAND